MRRNNNQRQQSKVLKKLAKNKKNFRIFEQNVEINSSKIKTKSNNITKISEKSTYDKQEKSCLNEEEFDISSLSRVERLYPSPELLKESVLHIKQGDIVLIDLGKTVGSEESGIRPCYVVSNNIGNKMGSTLVICPISTQLKKFPTHYTIKNYYDYGLSAKSQILFEQQRTIDKKRVKSLVVGHIDFTLIFKELFITYGFSIEGDEKDEVYLRRTIR